MTSTRQLAAIMFTDIVGYTALMGENSEKALELVRISKEIQKPLADKHNGKWLKEMGDGALVQFNTALDAVNCAIEIQDQARAKLDGKLRIGIHLGDVTIEDEDVYGDGVNVASRLESIADPGGIYISDAILKAIHGQSSIEVKDLGEIPLKNVSYELRTYAIQGLGLPVPAGTKSSKVLEPKKKYPIWASIVLASIMVILSFYLYPKFFQAQGVNSKVYDEISIAVLPFKNLSNDSTNEVFCDGMTNEVILRLGKIGGIHKVISFQSMMSYKGSEKTMPEIARELDITHILDASFQKSGDSIKVNLQLFDGPSDDLNWSDQYIGEWGQGDIFGIQAAVAESVTRNMGAQISEEEIEAIQKAPTDNTEAYALYLQARAMFWRGSNEDMYMAERLYEMVIELDTGFADAYAQLGWMKSRFWWTGGSNVSGPEEAYNTGMPYYEKALELDPENIDALTYSMYSTFLYKWDFETTYNYLQILNELEPDDALANTFIFYGMYDEAVKRAELAAEINPLASSVWQDKIISYYFNDQHEKSLRSIQTYLKGNFKNVHVDWNIARVYLWLGMYNEVIVHIEKIFMEYETSKENPSILALQAIASYHSGDLTKAEEYLKKIENQSNGSSTGSPSFHLAMIYAQMGEIDTSFECLEKAFENHDVEMWWLKLDPSFKPLHNDPRWQEILDKVGFPD